MLRLLLTVLIGIVTGVIGGALGINTSFIMLPALLILNIVPEYKMAVGTILLAILPPLSLLAVIDYYKRKQIDIVVSIILCLSYFFAAKYGATINKQTSNKTLKYYTAGILIVCGLYFLVSAHNEKA